MNLRDLRPTAEKPPKGWLTCRQWAKRWNLSEPRAGHLLKDGQRAKKVLRRTFRIQAGGRLYPVPHYRAA